MNGLFRTIAYWFLLTCFLVGSFAHAMDDSLQLTVEEQVWIKAHPVVTVANEMDWPPFDYVDQGKPAGYSIDVVRLIEQKTGLQATFINGYTWNELLEQFKAGNIDIMPAIYFNDERSQYTLFTQSYYAQPSVLVVNQDNNDIKGVENLTGKTVAGIRGFAITTTLEQVVPDIKIVPVNNILEGLKAVSLGEVEAFVDSIGTVTYTLDNNYIPSLKIIADVDHNGLANPPLYFGVAKDRRVLHSILDKAIGSISKQEKAALSEEWFPMLQSKEELQASEIILTPEQQTWLKAHPVIRLATDIAWPPFEYIDDNQQYQGMAADYMGLVEEKLGIRFEVEKNKTWTEAVAAVKQGDLDVFSCVASNSERETYVDFTRPYLSFPMVMVTQDTISYLDGVHDLKGMRVGVVDGYATHQYIEANHPELEVITSETSEEGIKAVSQGKIDVFVDNIATVSHHIQTMGLTNIKVSGEMPIRYELAMAVRKDWPEFVPMLQQALDSISDEQRREIHNKWIGVRYEHTFDNNRLWQLFFGFVVILGIFYIYNRKLAREIKQRKHAEQGLNRFKTTLDETMDCVFMFEPKTLKFFYINAGALEQVGYSYDELMTMTPYDIKPEIDEIQFRNIIAPLINGHQTTLNFETLHQHKDGHTVPVEIFLQYISPLGEPSRFVAIVRDITERRRVDKMKNEFISTVSHELRTPLTSIRGALGLINGGVVGQLPSKVKTMLDIASNNAERLSLLINDILDIQKIESGEMSFNFQALDLMLFLDKALEENANYGDQYGIKFSITHRLEGTQIWVDKDRMMQIMANLLSNAAKFSPKNGIVEIAVTRHQESLVRISVTDHGPGIPKEFHSKIFKKFSQADSSDTRSSGGTGLGLSITKALVEKLGGHVDFTSQQGIRTSFFIDLPEFKADA